ncbi:hypothetical protein Pcinc_044107 [Petrolisthes cinctipes]|uniref:Uncharacterized protein n=1 Tax=Petrolisthes cinctipes TaxID=88211 RepID=A0AAE1BEQ4_PETCI|nr:hypothetical protein Pcinc_044107 [Petrolisthes cinctipes]
MSPPFLTYVLTLLVPVYSHFPLPRLHPSLFIYIFPLPLLRSHPSLTFVRSHLSPPTSTPSPSLTHSSLDLTLTLTSVLSFPLPHLHPLPHSLIPRPDPYPHLRSHRPAPYPLPHLPSPTSTYTLSLTHSSPAPPPFLSITGTKPICPNWSVFFPNVSVYANTLGQVKQPGALARNNSILSLPASSIYPYPCPHPCHPFPYLASSSPTLASSTYNPAPIPATLSSTLLPSPSPFTPSSPAPPPPATLSSTLLPSPSPSITPSLPCTALTYP